MSEILGTQNRRDFVGRPTNNNRPKSKACRVPLILSDRGKPVPNVANAIAALRYTPEWRGVLHFNESKLVTCAKLAPPFAHAPRTPFNWGDEQDILTAAWLQGRGISVTKEIAAQAVQTVAREHPFHPIRDYLNSLKWDNVPRIANWLTLYLGADPSDYTRAVAEKWLIGAVTRIYRPGCKVDNCLILEGPQGALKSTALRVLAGDDFFTDDIADLGSKDSMIQTRGVWIIELAELDSMSRTEASRVKAFMSRQVDRIRLPYDRRTTDIPRECIFAGTVNHDSYLKDETGGRRFWPIKVGRIDIGSLTRDRDQLWAEARARFKSDANWWLDSSELVEAARDEQQARYEGDAWDDKIGEFLSLKSTVSITEILESCIDKPKKDWSRGDELRIARSLKSKGWIRYRETTADEKGQRPWRYRAPSQLIS
jgi:predicted P-loop ATPase